jgi:uncharacterized protein (DUF1919 family)
MKELIGKVYFKGRDYVNPLLAPSRRRQLERQDFTIFSNNCWAGHVYRYYQIPYNTPTIGLYFFSEDYIKFVSSYKRYLSEKLHFINYKESKYSKILEARNETHVLIGCLADVEIIFLHYKNQQEVYEKWNRRIERINFDYVLIKFSQMNLCEEKHLSAFDQLPFNRKLMFTNNPRRDLISSVYFKGYENQNEIINDTIYFKKYFNLTAWINGREYR